MCSKDVVQSDKTPRQRPKCFNKVGPSPSRQSNAFSELEPLSGSYHLKTVRNGNVVDLPNDAETFVIKVKALHDVLGIKKLTPRCGTRKQKNETSQTKIKSTMKSSKKISVNESQAFKSVRKKNACDVNYFQEVKHGIHSSVADAVSSSKNTQETSSDEVGEVKEMTLMEYMKNVKKKAKSFPSKYLKDSNILTSKSVSRDLEFDSNGKKFSSMDSSAMTLRKRKIQLEEENAINDVEVHSWNRSGQGSVKIDAVEIPSRKKRRMSEIEIMKSEEEHAKYDTEEISSMQRGNLFEMESMKTEEEIVKADAIEILSEKVSLQVKVETSSNKSNRSECEILKNEEIVKLDTEEVSTKERMDTLEKGSVNIEEEHMKTDVEETPSCKRRNMPRNKTLKTEEENVKTDVEETPRKRRNRPGNKSLKIEEENVKTDVDEIPCKKKTNMSKKGKMETQTDETFVLTKEETLACWQQKTTRLKSQRSSSHLVQGCFGVQVNTQELQGISSITNPENSSQKVSSSGCAGSSCTSQVDNKEMQDITESANTGKSAKITPSKSSSRSYAERQIDLPKSPIVVVDCHSTAAELDHIAGKRHTSESVSDKLTLQVVPDLVDYVLETGARSHHRLTNDPTMDTQAFASVSELNNRNLFVPSEENLNLDQCRYFSSGAKLKLSSSRVEVNQCKVNVSAIDNPNSNFFDLPEDEYPVNNDGYMRGSSHLESPIAISVVDVNNISTVSADLHATESLDIDQAECADVIQQQPTKLPSVRKAVTPISQKKQDVDFTCAFVKSSPAGSLSQESRQDAIDKLDIVSEPYISNSKGFTLRSPDIRCSGSPYVKRLQVEDFKRAFTKSPPAGNASHESKKDTTDKMVPVSESCDSNFKGFTFQSPDVKRSGSPYIKRLQVEDFLRVFSKSPPSGSQCQEIESDTTNKIDMVPESCDANLRDFAFQSLGECFTFQNPDPMNFAFQSPDVKSSEPHFQSKSAMRRWNSPILRPKSPQSRLFHHASEVTCSNGIQSSPLSQRKTSETSYTGNHRGVFPSPSIKGILKSPGVVCPTACKCDICSTIKVRADKASEFSLRQMRDIEALATNLMRELSSMRTIVERKLDPEADQFTADEIKTATSSALEVEETTKKWIAMMLRDCNRFCQIMKTPFDKRPSLSIEQHKQQRKLIFADEAGKQLCHFKYFEIDEKEKTPTKPRNLYEEIAESCDGSMESYL